MSNKAKWLMLCVLLLVATSLLCEERTSSFAKRLVALQKVLKPLHEDIRAPGPMDWLAEHEEKGQTFKQYVRGFCVMPTKDRNTIYIQPIGTFTPKQRQIVIITSDFMSRYFNLPVKIKSDLPLGVIPKKARRTNDVTGEQLLTTFILHDLLLKKKPRDAVAYIAFTASDLWPGKGWNYVFGQASLDIGVGVWSIHRFGNPDRKEEFNRCLRRTMKTAVHETGHMFSIKHCTLYECCMCGSNHMAESDSRPVWLCPECLPKLCWAMKADPVERYTKLQSFFSSHNLKPEEEFCKKSIAAIKDSQKK